MTSMIEDVTMYEGTPITLIDVLGTKHKAQKRPLKKHKSFKVLRIPYILGKQPLTVFCLWFTPA